MSVAKQAKTALLTWADSEKVADRRVMQTIRNVQDQPESLRR